MFVVWIWESLKIKNRTKANVFFKILVRSVTFAAAKVFPVRKLAEEKNTELCIWYTLQRTMKEGERICMLMIRNICLGVGRELLLLCEKTKESKVCGAWMKVSKSRRWLGKWGRDRSLWARGQRIFLETFWCYIDFFIHFFLFYLCTCIERIGIIIITFEWHFALEFNAHSHFLLNWEPDLNFFFIWMNVKYNI